MRKQPLLTDNYYHIYNRGVDKRDIFGDKLDLNRFIESIKEFNQIDKINSLSNLRKSKLQKINSQIAASPLSESFEVKPLVEILGYCLNPNHFHFILKQSADNGIAKFMHKLQGGYVSYFNCKNIRTGALFQGVFKSQIITDENYFNRIIAYVNKNYLIHNIPENKNKLVFSGDFEYENSKFNLINKIEGERILNVFGGVKMFKKHCDEIVLAIREERGMRSLLEEEDIPR